MTNKEFYKDKIFEIACQGDSIAFDILTDKMTTCDGLMGCNKCKFSGKIYGCKKAIQKWLEEEYVEPPVDWTKVKVDTKILVRDREDEEWKKRYFAKYENGKVYTFTSGRTSWTTTEVIKWECAKLYKAESEEEFEKI